MATKYVHFTDKQKRRANSVDLVDFLRAQGEEVTRSGHEYRWKRHDSVTIRGSRWFRHSTEEGGHAIDFVREFYGMRFPDAVTMLLNGESGAGFVSARPEPVLERKPFELPEKNSNNRRVFAYLAGTRCITPEVIAHFVRAGTLYEDAKYHNAVFVGLDANGQPRHAHKRSTLTFGEPFRANVEGSDARYGFGHVGKSDRLHVFEAPIDLLSYISLIKESWQEHSYLALNGVSDQALLQALVDHPHLRVPVLCLDNDAAGIAAANRITEKLKPMGYVVSHRLCCEKDWNEQLQMENRDIRLQEQESNMELNP